MHVLAHLADEGGGAAEALEGDQHVGGGTAGVALEELLAGDRGACVGEVDEELAECGNGEHVLLQSGRLARFPSPCRGCL